MHHIFYSIPNRQKEATALAKPFCCARHVRAEPNRTDDGAGHLINHLHGCCTCAPILYRVAASVEASTRRTELAAQNARIQMVGGLIFNVILFTCSVAIISEHVQSHARTHALDVTLGTGCVRAMDQRNSPGTMQPYYFMFYCEHVAN